jgi:anti-sigma-K factor RskA
VYVFDLAPLPPQKTYELWAVARSGEKLPAGTFDLDPSGAGSITYTIPAGVEVAAIEITDEPVGGAQAPTGAVQLTGKPAE